ncbi:uncharacterized protein O3C94_013682 [Discoglossus pictus]
MMDANHQTLPTLGMPANRNTVVTGFHDENPYPELINEEGEYETEENYTHHVELHSHPCEGSENVKPSIFSKLGHGEETNVMRHKEVKDEATPIIVIEGLHHENLDTVIKKEEDESAENDILQVTIHSDLCAESSNLQTSVVPKLKQEVMVAKDQLKIKEENIPIHISEGSSMGRKIPGQYSSLLRSEHWVNGVIDVTESHKEPNHISDMPYKSMEQGEGSVSQFLSHQNNLTGDKPFICSECGKCFTYKSNLLCHVRIHTGVKPFACSECGKCFSDKRSFVSHERIHTGEKPFACAECGKCFTIKSRLVKHEKTHSDEKPFICSVCGKGFINKTYLVIHYRTHTGEKPFACCECGKCFSKKNTLVTHEKIHKGGKSFECPVCGKCFTQKSSLCKHQRTHTGEKPFECSECGKCFSQKSTLVTHLMLHTNVKPFACSECGRCFSQKSSLVIHQRSHTGEKPFACSECGKFFSDRSARAKHQKLKICQKI